MASPLVLGDCEILIRFSEILDLNFPIMLYAFDGHFDVILLLRFLEQGFCKLVAFRVEREPLAVGKNAVAASGAFRLQRTCLQDSLWRARRRISRLPRSQ
jgi:hypothetical protein